jgi:hypothetical protein
MVLLTRECIDQLKTPAGGFTYALLRELGAEFVGRQPLPWRNRIEGKTWVSEEKWAALVAASKQNGPPQGGQRPTPTEALLSQGSSPAWPA